MEHSSTSHHTCSFQVFPEEVWEKIVDHTECAMDIQNIFEALPSLFNISPSRHFSWIFGKILPLIMFKVLTLDDILTIRQVSKRWKDSVETCLENHPEQRPYDPSAAVDFNETHFNFERLPCKAIDWLRFNIRDGYALKVAGLSNFDILNKSFNTEFDASKDSYLPKA